MKSVKVTGVNQVEFVEIDAPVAGPADVIVRIRACGICGSDAFYTHIGGIPPREGDTCLGHEPAGEIVEVGADVEGLELGDHVVFDPISFEDGILGNGGAQGAFSELVLVTNAVAGKQIRTIPKNIPWEVAALNEPMAVALHGVNRSFPSAGDKVVVFGAGPIGLGALIGFKSRGAHVVVADVIPSRLEKALAIGADAVINSATEDVAARLGELHGSIPARPGHGPKVGTDIYLDAAGVGVVIQTAIANAKHGAKLTVVAVHKKPVEVDFSAMLTTEMVITTAMGYPTEIFEVTEEIIAHTDRYAKIISDVLPYERALEAFTLASTPGAADKVVVTFGE